VGLIAVYLAELSGWLFVRLADNSPGNADVCLGMKGVLSAIVRPVKSIRIKWTMHVVRMEDVGDTCRRSVGLRKGKRSLVRLVRCDWERFLSNGI
jgi:hypothetical protein